MQNSSNRLLRLVDEKTGLAGSNKMELLSFSLGGSEIYGINVFKVCEVCEMPVITRTPNMPPGVEGVTSLRGTIIPVVNLAHFLGMELAEPTKIMITEFSGHVQGLLVKDVDRIMRVDWETVKTPQGILSSRTHMVTAIANLPDGRLVSILDVEQILHDAMGEDPVPELEPIENPSGRIVFFADDSPLARKKIAQFLDSLHLSHQHANNGRDAWEQLQAMCERVAIEGVPLSQRVGVILIDAEMPEMDGYKLIRLIKESRKFQGIPVVMHSSLSSVANRSMGQKVGADAYVPKFDAVQLAATLRKMLSH